MRPDNKIRSLFAQSSVNVRAQYDDRIMNDAFAALGQPDRTESAAKHPGLWRIIIKSKITKCAAAAVIITAIALAIYLPSGSVDVLSVAMAQMEEAMGNTPWMHVVTSEGKEYWYCFEPKIEAVKHRQVICYYNRDKQERHVYDPNSDTIVISHFRGGLFLSEVHGAESPWDVLRQFFRSRRPADAKVDIRTGKYDGTEVKIYTVTIPEHASHQDIPPAADIIWEIIVDSQTALPIVYGQPGRPELSFDFPQDGPRDLYDLGAPQSAKVIDLRPEPEATMLLEAFSSYRNTFHSLPYLSVGQSIIGDNAHYGVTYNDTRLWRADGYYVEEWKEYEDQIGNTIDSIVTWLTTSEFSKHYDIYLFAGEYSYSMSYRGLRKDWITDKNPARGKPISGAIPNLPTLKRWLRVASGWRIIEDEYSRTNELICVEFIFKNEDDDWRPDSLDRSLVYLNPAKDYHCQKVATEAQRPPERFKEDWEEYSASGFFEVKEFFQVQDGLWYPRMFEHWECNWNRDGSYGPLKRRSVTTIYMDTEPVFPEGIFDPNGLPQ
ncbi:MAG: hypothetical protein ACYS8Z_19150 [Planctomycetota bacterium]|jgi:hypothetical protein